MAKTIPKGCLLCDYCHKILLIESALHVPKLEKKVCSFRCADQLLKMADGRRELDRIYFVHLRGR